MLVFLLHPFFFSLQSSWLSTDIALLIPGNIYQSLSATDLKSNTQIILLL